MLGEHLRAVQVAERDVVHAVEHGAVDVLDPADGDGALGFGGRGTADKSVCEHDGTRSGGRVARSSRMRRIASVSTPVWPFASGTPSA